MFDESQETFACSRDLLHRVLLARTVFIVQEKMLRFPRGFIGSLGRLVNYMFDESQETFACSRDLLHRVLLARTVSVIHVTAILGCEKISARCRANSDHGSSKQRTQRPCREKLGPDLGMTRCSFAH